MRIVKHGIQNFMIVSCLPLQVLRPGVLWFLRNLNDPDFNPVQEMIHLPIYRHLRRFILSVVRAFLMYFFTLKENLCNTV